MKALVVFDSTWGNTEKIAKAIAEGIGGDTRAVRVGTTQAAELDRLDLLVLGSPVLGGRSSPAMQALLGSLPRKKLTVATFDTRLVARFTRIFGFAATRMADTLKEMGHDVTSTEGFFVRGRAGPLAEGEIERATQWGKSIRASSR